ncbi:PREDICTED: uncharacterized protein LOC105957261 isoform X1 [Erythranthe guttata]|uniref:uncharacterized protein LOC105957261 isoform X1 n=1 Tax=Erythranthe guttata TaxID=4155 RepID=UPI00064DC985|nr:PREDICTED: uncharacterized protein LOC105957261 isoform X1 [Erythranthe guttata]|eukprot:XP_012836649.1 PREDICTED: uncharacterized protein LOC105957261 isoform X1 [Erythranthe guttata]
MASLPMALGGEVFERSIQSSIHEKIELDNGVKTLGVQKMEHVLPVGTCLTVIGEVIRDEAGNFVIQKPCRGFPFFVSYRSVSEIIHCYRDASRFNFYPCIYVICKLKGPISSVFDVYFCFPSAFACMPLRLSVLLGWFSLLSMHSTTRKYKRGKLYSSFLTCVYKRIRT